MTTMTTRFGTELPTELRDAAQGELQEGERILWTGQPDAHRAMFQSGCLTLFGIPWTAFAVFWTVMAAGGVQSIGKGSPWAWLFPLWGLPFIAIGIGMLLAPLWAWRHARNTAYVVTNKRILFITLGKFTKTQAFLPSSDDLERSERADGTGDLTFLKQYGRDSDGDRTTNKMQFVGVPEVRRVETLLVETFFEAKRSEGGAAGARTSIVWKDPFFPDS